MFLDIPSFGSVFYHEDTPICDSGIPPLSDPAGKPLAWHYIIGSASFGLFFLPCRFILFYYCFGGHRSTSVLMLCCFLFSVEDTSSLLACGGCCRPDLSSLLFSLCPATSPRDCPLLGCGYTKKGIVYRQLINPYLS